MVEVAGAELLHLDIMDGHFAPNLSFGVPVVKSIAQCTQLPLDTHLMITDPGQYASKFVEAGATSLTFHIEAIDQPRQLVRQIRDLGVQVGVSLNPGTPPEALDEVIADVDMVLVMTVWPGFGGQRFMAECLEKIETLSGRLNETQRLEVDGGINPETAQRVASAGADTLVAGSAIFHAEDPPGVITALRRAAEEGVKQRSLEPKL